MQNSKLIKLLGSLTKVELKKFGEFVSSPYFNKNSNLVKLLKSISKYSPDYQNGKLERENVYAEIMNGKKYNVKVMKNLMTGLLNLLLKFLEQKNYEKNTGRNYSYLIDELLNRNQYPLIKGIVKKAEPALNGSLVNEDYFYNNLKFHELKYSYELRTKPGMERVIMPVQLLENLFSYFLMYYFKYNYNLLVRKDAYDFEADLRFIEIVVKYVETQEFRDKEIMRIYYNIFMSVMYPEKENHFFELKKLAEKYGRLLDKGERHNLYSVMQGYCMRKIERRNDYKKILFDVCRQMLSTGSYTSSESGLIMPLIYKNIVKAAAKVGEFDWALNFTEEYMDKLLPAFQKDVYNYSQALCFFKMGEYTRSLEKLSAVKYENVYDKAEGNRLLLQLYFEMNLSEELYSLADTFKHFLHNDRIISAIVKKGVYNFINFTVSVRNLEFSNEPAWEAARLGKEISETTTYERDWLLEKIELYK